MLMRLGESGRPSLPAIVARFTDFTRKNIMTKFVSRFVKDESGATAIEYGLIAALIAVVIIGAVQLVGTNLSATFGKVSAKLG
jgi:pilus assembly protein Flp/PilA